MKKFALLMLVIYSICHCAHAADSASPSDQVLKLRCTGTPDPKARTTPLQAQILENFQGGSIPPSVYDFDLNLTKLTVTDGFMTNALTLTETFFAFKNWMQSEIYIDRVAATFTATGNPDDPAKTTVFSGRCVARKNAF